MATTGPEDTSVVDQMRILREAYIQSNKLVNRQEHDLDRLLESVRVLKSELHDVQVRVECLEAKSITASKERELAISKSVQKSNMAGPLARRAIRHTISHQSAADTRATGLQQNHGYETSRTLSDQTMRGVDMSGTVAASSYTVEESLRQQLRDDVGGLNAMEPSSHGSRGRQPTSIANLGPGETSNLVDSLTAPSRSMGQSPQGSRDNLGATIPTPDSASKQEILETQRYRKRLRLDDPDDDDYISSTGSTSLVSLSGRFPPTQDRQSSLNNILDPTTPRLTGERPARSRESGRKGLRTGYAWVEDLRETPEWERDDWAASDMVVQDGRTIGPVTPARSTPSRPRGQQLGRRGVSGRPGSHSATKRKPLQDWNDSERERDSEGYLLKADGSRDMRSARHRDRKSEEVAAGGGVGGLYTAQHEALMGEIHPERRR